MSTSETETIAQISLGFNGQRAQGILSRHRKILRRLRSVGTDGKIFRKSAKQGGAP